MQTLTDRLSVIAGLMPVDTAEAQGQNQVIFLVNFLDELRCKVPVGK